MNNPIFIRELEIQPYLETYQAMHEFTKNRNNHTYDEIWLVEHPSTFTQGKAGKPEHLLRSTTIPVIQSDRGGQITYHGLGQQIMYVLLDLKRLKIKVRDVVTCLEQAVINTLNDYQIKAYAKPDAPGVYIEQKKVCSLGLHIKNGCTLHGLALNIDMDLSPFDLINPCGYQGLKMTQLKDYTNDIDREEINQLLVEHFVWLLTHTPN